MCIRDRYGRYQKAVSQMEAGQYDEAYAAFLALGDYDGAANQATSCRYYQAQRLYEAADWAAAGAIFESLGDYRKSPSLAADCQYRQADVYKRQCSDSPKTTPPAGRRSPLG